MSIPRCRDCVHYEAPGICRCPCGPRPAGINDLCACEHFKICPGQES